MRRFKVYHLGVCKNLIKGTLSGTDGHARPSLTGINCIPAELSIRRSKAELILFYSTVLSVHHINDGMYHHPETG